MTMPASLKCLGVEVPISAAIDGRYKVLQMRIRLPADPSVNSDQMPRFAGNVFDLLPGLHDQWIESRSPVSERRANIV